MFREEERKEFVEDGLTDEEIDMLESTLALCETVELIPDDIESFLKEYEKKVPADTLGGMKAIVESAEKDPEFFKKLIALDLAIDYDINQRKEDVKKPSDILDGLTDEEYKKASENYFNTISKLTDEDRMEFLKLITNLTQEQKTDMIERLKG